MFITYLKIGIYKVMFVSLNYIPNNMSVQGKVYHRMTFTKNEHVDLTQFSSRSRFKKIVSIIKIVTNFLFSADTNTHITHIHVWVKKHTTTLILWLQFHECAVQ
jgi:hypothetical protein